MKYRGVFCLFLCVLLLLGTPVPGLGGEAQPAHEPMPFESTATAPSAPPLLVSSGDEELDRALACGFVPGEVWENREKIITWAQFCAMLSNMIAIVNEEAAGAFEAAAGSAMTMTRTMKRDGGTLALYYAADALDCSLNYAYDWVLHDKIGDKCWDEISWSYGEAFPGWDIGTDEVPDKMTMAYFDVLQRISLRSGKHCLEYDPQTNSMHMDKSFTCEEAIRATLRLYDATYHIAADNPFKGEMRDMTSAEIVADIVIGINFAGCVDALNDQCGYDSELLYDSDLSKKGMYKHEFYETRGDAIVGTEPMIAALSEAGYDAVRLPVSWTPFLNDTTFEIDEHFMDIVEFYVNMILEHGMYCIIEPHYDYMSWTSEFGGGSSWVGDHWSGAWMLPEYAPYVDARFKALWTQIANRFRDYNEKVLFEAMNEPYIKYEAYQKSRYKAESYDDLSNRRVNEMNAIFVSTVRNTGGNNAKRHLLLSSWFEKPDTLETLEIPDDEHLIATVHTYYDWDSKGKLRKAWSRKKKNLAAEVDRSFKEIDAFMERTGLPVIIGEFATEESMPLEDRLDQATYIVEKAKKLGCPCFWWEYGWHESEAGHNMAIYDRVHLEWKWPELVEATVKAATLDAE